MCAPACATSSIGFRVQQLRARDAEVLGVQQELGAVHARLAKAGVDCVSAIYIKILAHILMPPPEPGCAGG